MRPASTCSRCFIKRLTHMHELPQTPLQFVLAVDQASTSSRLRRASHQNLDTKLFNLETHLVPREHRSIFLDARTVGSGWRGGVVNNRAGFVFSACV